MNENENKKEVENVNFETSQLSLAAYLMTKGLKLLDLSVGNGSVKKDRFNFILLDPNKEAEKLKIDFLNSESHSFDSFVRLLKMMISSRKKELNSN